MVVRVTDDVSGCSDTVELDIICKSNTICRYDFRLSTL